MLQKERPVFPNYRQRVYSQILIRPPQRLIFPNKQAEQGYIGKKHFSSSNHDNVILQSPGNHKITRKDKLDIADIQGAKPKLIQPLQNIRKQHQRDSTSVSSHNRRSKTEAQDSLDVLIRNQTDKKTKRNDFENQISNYLWKRNVELTKQNILGIYTPSSI